MTRFVTRRVVRSRSPEVVVDAGLAVGRHQFQLTAIDAAGNRSKPARVTITVQPARDARRQASTSNRLPKGS